MNVKSVVQQVFSDRKKNIVERIDFLYRVLPIGLAVNFLLSILMVLVLWQRTDKTLLIMWFGLVFTLSLIRYLLVVHYKRSVISESKMYYWLIAFLATSTLSGLAWGALIWIFTPFDDPLTPLLIIFTVGGLTAGAAATLSPVLFVYIFYVSAVMAPLSTWCFVEGSEEYYVMGMMILLYIVSMALSGIIYQKVLIRSIRLSKDLIESKEAAEVANNAKTEFLSSISHELRTPLNSILGFAQLMESDKQSTLSVSEKENLSYILKSGHHLLNLINDVLDLAKIESGKDTIKLARLDAYQIIEDSVSITQHLAKKKNVTVQINTDDRFYVYADDKKFKQAVLNLLSNAIKYNREQGHVEISIVKGDHKSVRFTFTDTGLGIATKLQGRLFMPFDRLGQEASEIEGSGIGLYVTKKTIEAMDGRVGYQSNKNKGSSFWFELPLSL